MTTWLVLLRGINVGGRNKLPMAALRTALTDAGFSAVQTLIQSGNIVCQSPHDTAADTRNAIAASIRTTFDLEPGILVLSPGEFAAAVAANPWPDAEGKHVHLSFFEVPPAEPNLAALTALAADDESIHLGTGCFYLHAPSGIGRSKLAAAVERHLGVAATARNLRTVRKLEALLAALP